MVDEEMKLHRIDEGSIYANLEYLANNPSWHVEESPWKADKIYEILRRNGLAPSRIAEVGCGAGEILVQLKARLPATSFVGYEMSEQAFKLAATRERDGIHYVKGNLLEFDESFGALLCIDVFEHVDDYIGFIKALKSRAEYKVFHIPLDLSVQSVLRGDALNGIRSRVGHLHYFTKQTALETIRYCGYDVIDYNFMALAIEPPGRGLRANLMKVPRVLLSKLSVDLAARILGGWSLMVLAK